MRKLMVGALALLASTPAWAANPPAIIYTAGVYGIPSYTSASVFESFNVGTVAGFQYNPALHNATSAFQESVSGPNIVGNGTVPSVYVVPQSGSTSNYLAVGDGFNNASFTVSLAGGVQVFSFIFGSLDSYNSLKLTFADGTSYTYSGQQIDGTGAATAATVHYSDSGRVTYDAQGGPSITQAVFSSAIGAFEIDDLAAATPEPSTWAMMILGFGIVGAGLRSRRRKGTLAVA